MLAASDNLLCSYACDIHLSTFLGKAQYLSQGRIILRTCVTVKQHFNDGFREKSEESKMVNEVVLHSVAVRSACSFCFKVNDIINNTEVECKFVP